MPQGGLPTESRRTSSSLAWKLRRGLARSSEAFRRRLDGYAQPRKNSRRTATCLRFRGTPPKPGRPRGRVLRIWAGLTTRGILQGMAHQSLYRTYRPKRFEDIVGQDQVV